MPRLVPNVQPTIHNTPYKIAIVGEAPGQTEDERGVPFVGFSGQLLESLLGRARILRSACLVANVCQYRPPENDIDAFDWDGTEIQTGLDQLKADIQEADPNLVVLLGATALRAAGRKDGIMGIRGTFFVCDDVSSPFFGRKCMASYHPAACLRMYSWTPILGFDLARARSEGTSKEWNPPLRSIRTALPFDELCQELERIRDQEHRLAFDIEGYGETGVTCLCFAPRRDYAVVVPFHGFSEGSYWTPEQEIVIWRLVSEICADTRKTFLIQNAIYDVTVMLWRHRILVRGKIEDSMLIANQLFCELPKSLGFCCSVYTKEPAYKEDGRNSEDYQGFWKYNGTDGCVLHEIVDTVEPQLTPGNRAHYRFNMALFPAIMYMQVRGQKYDRPAALAFGLDNVRMAEEFELQIAKLHTMCPNVNSPKQVADFLYKRLGLPEQKNRKTKRVTTDKEALYKLNLKVDSPALKLILKGRKHRKIDSDCRGLTVNADQRIRCSLKVAGTESMRFACDGSPTGSGRNLQNITKKLRKFFKSDTGMLYCQQDLSGADGWTVAARCAQQGDPTMWDDYVFGLKPAKILFLMLKHDPAKINRMSREELKELCKTIDSDGADYDMYFSCKRVQHGTNYQMQEETVSMTVLKDSDGDIALKLREAGRMQTLYKMRYPGLEKWWRWVGHELARTGGITHASGHHRHFFGRPNDSEVLRTACADEPQGNTTYAVKLALMRLWYDKENRRRNGSLIIEPIHTVHDSLNTQFPADHIHFAKVKLHQWFDNKIQVGDKIFAIPFEGNFGPSWGECTTPL